MRFPRCLDSALRHTVWFRAWTQGSLGVPSNSGHSMLPSPHQQCHSNERWEPIKCICAKIQKQEARTGLCPGILRHLPQGNKQTSHSNKLGMCLLHSLSVAVAEKQLCAGEGLPVPRNGFTPTWVCSGCGSMCSCFHAQPSYTKPFQIFVEVRSDSITQLFLQRNGL